MNNISKNILLALLPFYPFWAWISYFGTDKGIGMVFSLIMLPLAGFFILSSSKRLPTYLIFYILFTLYHLYSIISNNLVPSDINIVFFLLSDTHILACAFLIVIENTDFDKKTLAKMSQFILITLAISLIVSVIQIKDHLIFFNPVILSGPDNDLSFLEDERIYSIYTWINLSTVGISVPILCSILINTYTDKRAHMLFIIFSGIVISFLTKSRYVMMSIVVVFSQLILINIKLLANKIFIIILFIGGLFLIAFMAKSIGYKLDEVIENRIMEKENEMGSAKARVTSYEVFLKKYPENPILGVGPKTRDDVIDLLGGEAPMIHVGYLSYLYYYGIVGTLFLMIALFLLVRQAWFVGKQYNFWAGFFGLLSFLLANLTLVYFELGEMGILLVIVYLRYFRTGGVERDAENELQAAV